MKDTEEVEKNPSPSRDLKSKAWPLDVQIISIVGKSFKIDLKKTMLSRRVQLLVPPSLIVLLKNIPYLIWSLAK